MRELETNVAWNVNGETERDIERERRTRSLEEGTREDAHKSHGKARDCRDILRQGREGEKKVLSQKEME
jgi:hypothetical protein